MPWTNEWYNHHLEIHSPYKQNKAQQIHGSRNSHLFHGHFLLGSHCSEPPMNSAEVVAEIVVSELREGFLGVFVFPGKGKFLGKFPGRCKETHLGNEAGSFMFILRLLKDSGIDRYTDIPMTLVLDWSSGLVLEGWPWKIEVSWVLNPRIIHSLKLRIPVRSLGPQKGSQLVFPPCIFMGKLAVSFFGGHIILVGSQPRGAKIFSGMSCWYWM